jgi:Cu+-exporting ATPase
MKIQLSLAVLVGALLLLITACYGNNKADTPEPAALSDSPTPSEAKSPEAAKAAVAQTEPAPGKALTSFDAVPPFGTKATCSVMGNEFAIKESSDHSEYKGKHYFFCCPGCKPKFDANPEKYIQ